MMDKTRFSILLVVWIIGMLLGFSVLGGIVYVIIHFLQKMW